MEPRFIPTDEQVMIGDGVRRWVERDHVAEGPANGHWAHFAEMGWLMAALPERAGGLGGDVYDAAIIAQELGRGLVRAPFVEVGVVAAQVLLDLAPDRVADLASGQARPVLAHDERAARGDPGWVETVARLEDGAWRLTGHKTAVVGAPLATSLLVSATTPGGGQSIFEVAPADAGLLAFKTIDDREAAELRLDRTVGVPIGPVGGAAPAIEKACCHALVLESAEAVGAMQRALEMTRDYLLVRRQYGHQIGDFQALRHRLADMFIELEQARSMMMRGLAALVEGEPLERALVAAATKARVGQASQFVGAQAIQLHGGIGVTREHPVSHYFRRLLATDLRHGGAARHVERVAVLRRSATPT